MRDDRKQELGQRIERQGERECAAASGLAGAPHPTPVQSDNFFGDVQPQTQAGLITIHRVRVLVEALENLRDVLRGNAPAAITYREIDAVRIGLDRAALTVTDPPDGVNLIPLSIRLTRTSRARSGS